MAKKSRRVRKQGREVRLSATQMVQPTVAEVGNGARAAIQAQPASKEADLGEEYRYVIADLKRIGIIAVGMLAVLIVLAYLLT
jgi:cell division protein FtsX